jgi:hypothetical protein
MLDEEKSILEEGGESRQELAEKKAQRIADDILEVQKSEDLVQIEHICSFEHRYGKEA